MPAPTKQPGDGPTDSYNCHGFVFTKGDRCIGKKPDGSDIQKILDDNDYAKRAPGTVQEGDLAVYHDGTKLTHTGVVTGVAAGAATEVHSKWGPWARYKHAPGSVPPSYGTANYCHSARLGHNLR